MTGPSAPLGATTGGSQPPLSEKSIRALFENLKTRVKRLEANRTPQPLQMHQLANTGPMSQANPGHSSTFDTNSGTYVPSPNLASLIFHMPGTLSIATSPPHHARYDCYIVGISADIGTLNLGDVITFELLINGTAVATLSADTEAGGFQPINPPIALAAYSDLVTLATTSAGASGASADLVVHVELGSYVSGHIGPLPPGS